MQLLLMPRFLLSVTAGVVSYGLMVFVMTAAPMAMVEHGHSVDHAALAIQWHVLAMFAPSFLTGYLITWFGKERITAAGLLLIALSGAVALSGLGLFHFWTSLILLGIGWNFGFIGDHQGIWQRINFAEEASDLALCPGEVQIGGFEEGFFFPLVQLMGGEAKILWPLAHAQGEFQTPPWLD